MKKFSKILSVLLCVAMLLGLAAVVGAEGEVTTATLVTDVKSLAAGDQVVILNTAGTKAMSISSDNGKFRTLTDATVTDNKVTVTTAMQILTLEAGTGTGTFAFKAGEDGYLSAKLNANELWTLSKTDDQLPEYSSWTISQITGEGVATISQVLSADETRYLQYNSGSPRFAAYKASSKQAPVSIYKLDDASSGGEEADPTTAGLVTDLSKLADGDKIVIVANEDAKALSTTQDKNNRPVAEVVKSEDLKTVTLTEAVQVITLEKDSETGLFAFK
ncbi:MAG: hypothetical protein PUB93_06260, partial [Firmicutes bacterium]|nr:hypothetical protein [Bacillota bacterium]